MVASTQIEPRRDRARERRARRRARLVRRLLLPLFALVVIAAIVVIVLLVLLAVASVRVVREYERVVAFRLGRLRGPLGPGVIIMLPFLDQVRLRLCDHLTDRYGADWPVRWLPPLSVDDEEAAVRNPQSCQWGHLDTLLRECASLAGEKACQRVASAARPLRNRLAHYVPVNATDYARLVALADAVGRRTPGGRPLG